MSTVITYNVKVNEVYDNCNIIFGSQLLCSKYNIYSIEKADLNFDDYFQIDPVYFNINLVLDRKVKQYFRS